MPIYEYECEDCGEQYESLASMNEDRNVDIQCPKCESKKKSKLASVGAIVFSNPVGTDKWSNSHDYRYKWHMENNVIPQRRAAEEKSHVGSSPYEHIDDISSGNHFGEVK